MDVIKRSMAGAIEQTTDPVSNMGVVDLRDENERSCEQRAQTALDSENETLAGRLMDLIIRQRALYNTDRTAADKLQEEIQQIGQQLCENGGHNRMVLIAYRGAVLGRGRGVRVRDFEFHWDGICGWMY